MPDFVSSQDYRQSKLGEINKINDLNLEDSTKKSLVRKALKDILSDAKIQEAQEEKRNKKKQEKTAKKLENKEYKYNYLLNKPNMTIKDNENMQKSIDFLIEKKMDTLENIKKLEAITYGFDYREIGGIRFSREKFVPNVKFNDKPNKYGVFESEKRGIYKALYKGKPEYYLTSDTYRDQTKEQGKKAVKYTHIRQAFMALPIIEDSESGWFGGGNILGNILDLSRSGRIALSLGKLMDVDECCYLGSEHKMYYSNIKNKTRPWMPPQCGERTVVFMEIDHPDLGVVGQLTKQVPTNARPCLYIV